MNGASHGIIAHVYLVNNCGSYLKKENGAKKKTIVAHICQKEEKGACIAHRWRHMEL
jgi:hypothetical protein